jgi:hypothetical protein
MYKKFIYYPLLFFLYPVLSLWAHNVREISPLQVYRALLVTILLGFLFLVISWLAVRHWEKAALISSAAYLLVFSYGHFFNFLKQVNDNPARHRYVLAVYGCLFLAWVLVVLRQNEQIKMLSSMFNLMGFTLLIMPAYVLAAHMFNNVNKGSQPVPVVAVTGNNGQRPDIYYIILDGYGREDILKKYYEYDNSALIDYLEGKGFYVADRGRSNYISTVLSLSSSLNMQYIDTLLPDTDPLVDDEVQLVVYESDLLELIHHSEVRSFLARNGYRLVTYDNDFKTTARDADVLLAYSSLFPRAGGGESRKGSDVNGFEGLLLETSIARSWIDWQAAQGRGNILIESPYSGHRARVLDMFEALKEIPQMEGDNFVFMHFLVPHPPFVFGPNGEMIRHDVAFTLSDGVNYPGTPRKYAREYSEQISYINQYLEEAVNSIIDNSETPPIIIIQGDHGPRKSLNFKNPKMEDLEGSFSILNAYYLPNIDQDVLYPTITPVNSFRIVLNIYLDAGFDLLPDENYLSNSVQPFNFINVTDLLDKFTE